MLMSARAPTRSQVSSSGFSMMPARNPSVSTATSGVFPHAARVDVALLHERVLIEAHQSRATDLPKPSSTCAG